MIVGHFQTDKRTKELTKTKEVQKKCVTNGPMDQRTNGLTVQRTYGPSD